MSRASIRVLAARAAAHIAANPGFVPTLYCTAIGVDKSLRLLASVKVDGGSEEEVCGDNGKIKTFSDLDGVVKAMSKIRESSNGVYAITVDTGVLFASSAPANVQAYYEAQIVRLGRVKTHQQAVSSNITADLILMDGWDVGNAAQQARFAEVTAQKAAVEADIAALTAEINRLTALV